MEFPLSLPAIIVQQPLGKFFVTRISARTLLQISYSNPLRVNSEDGELLGSQRPISGVRTREIASYIDTVESAFPNSIIVAANYDINGRLEDNEDTRWRIENEEDDCSRLIIPSEQRLACIIDGQHRLNGFNFVVNQDRLDMDLLCVVYIDLPNPYQAYIFATININQRKVDKSLAYELFGYNLDDEPVDTWSPEKLAVSFSRRLNTETSSVFYNHIVVAPQNDKLLFDVSAKDTSWHTSTATVVEGILGLITTNAKRDRDLIHALSIRGGRTRRLAGNDKSPLRSLYLDGNDLVVFTAVSNFFKACDEILFSTASSASYIFKTVGIQALFDILKKY